MATLFETPLIWRGNAAYLPDGKEYATVKEYKSAGNDLYFEVEFTTSNRSYFYDFKYEAVASINHACLYGEFLTPTPKPTPEIWNSEPINQVPLLTTTKM